MSTKLSPPQLTDESAEGFDRFILQFERYICLTKPNDDDRLDLLLLCVGNKGAGYYNELTWAKLTDIERAAGITEYSRAKVYLHVKFCGDKHVLIERMHLYFCKQSHTQSINDYVSALRLI